MTKVGLEDMKRVWDMSMIEVPSLKDELQYFTRAETTAIRGLAFEVTPKVARGELDPTSPAFFSDLKALLSNRPEAIERISVVTRNEQLGGIFLKACLTAQTFEGVMDG